MEIKYELLIEFPSGEKLDILKSKYETPEYLLDRYIRPYLMLISNLSASKMTAIEIFSEKRGEFTELIKKQIVYGLAYKDHRYSVGTFKNHGLKVTVLMLYFKYEEYFIDQIENLNKVQIEIEIAKAQAEARLKLAEKAYPDSMEMWIKSRRKK